MIDLELYKHAKEHPITISWLQELIDYVARDAEKKLKLINVMKEKDKDTTSLEYEYHYALYTLGIDKTPPTPYWNKD